MSESIDKSTWPPGPWHDEPDYLEWMDAGSGYTCIMKRHPNFGHWCGYVQLPPGHGLWSQGSLRLEEYPVHVHGSITGGLDSHTPGFDCGHSQDLSPAMGYHLTGAVYRDAHFVINECQNLARQLKEYE